ncbi:MAG: ABC-F family ATP-binding cassette domain-containing protein, partial [Bacteroidales bacterium]|nr:ABC-F family ATP-binding cassette domain-containing protein [Bacteroidales bacterium]
MISINNVTVTFSGTELFQDISFVINPKDRIGLTGKNGAGKSTLLKVITGEQPVEKGSVTIPQNVTLGYLPQHMELPSGLSVIEETMTCFEDTNFLQDEVDKLTLEITNRTDYESESYLKLVNTLSEYQERLELFSDTQNQAKAEVVLKGLGFKQSDFQ